MAAARHNLSRRAVLGAGVGACAGRRSSYRDRRESPGRSVRAEFLGAFCSFGRCRRAGRPSTSSGRTGGERSGPTSRLESRAPSLPPGRGGAGGVPGGAGGAAGRAAGLAEFAGARRSLRRARRRPARDASPAAARAGAGPCRAGTQDRARYRRSGLGAVRRGTLSRQPEGRRREAREWRLTIAGAYVGSYPLLNSQYAESRVDRFKQIA